MTASGQLPTPERLGALWRFDGYGALSSRQRLVAAGDRLLGVAGSTLFAIDIFHGKEPVPDAQVAVQGFPYSFKSIYGGDPYVAASGGVVYFMDGDELTALRLSDGQPLQIPDKDGKWTPWTPPMLESVSGLFAVDNKIIAVHVGPSGEAAVTGFVAINGTRAFGPVVISDLSPGRVSYGEGAVFFVADERLHAVNVDFGDARFERTQGGIASEPLSPSAAPCVASNVVAAVGALLHFFDVKTGARLFTPIAPAREPDVWSTPVLADKGKLFIASNTGEVVAIRTSDGSIAWRTPLSGPGEPSLIPGRVLVTTDSRRMLATLSLATGELTRRMELPEVAGDLPPVVTNDTIFIPDAGGSLEARPFARQHAAYFDGVSSCIDVEADDRQFDFGIRDFTIEAWIRSSEGGEIVSSHVTEPNSQEHGFRLNLGENGELRVAIVDESAKRIHAGRTRATRANDGEWHHVALIRCDHTLLALLDGKSHDVFFHDKSTPGLSIGGKSALTIGAARPAAGKPAEQHFNGLIRELRIWDRALDVATVQNNRHVQLTGNEPRLKGLWTLAEQQRPGAKTDPVNAVVRHRARATFNNAASALTDLRLDSSGFPYLLHEVRSHWPYAGTWAARGEQPVNTSAALTNSAIAFGTNNALYGVRRADGRRLWQLDMPGAASAPVAEGGRFFLLTSDDGLIGVNATNGEFAPVDAFAGFMKPTTAALATPAITPTHIAIGTPSGAVRIVDRLAEPIAARDVSVAAPVHELAFSANHLFALCGASGSLQLASISLAGARTENHAVSSKVFAADHEWLFCVRNGKLTRLTAASSADALVAGTSITGTITGMAARRDRDLLVVGTDSGEVLAFAMSDLSQRWRIQLPAGRSSESHSVYRPVFDRAGRVCCTTTSGTIAILDPDTGVRAGLYIGNEGAVTPAMFSAATAYYGCADALGVDAYRDGALHSVVFGDTMVLRLGLNERGTPSAVAPYAVVDIQTVDAAKHTLHLMNPSRSCVEAWINVPPSSINSARRPGGGVLRICPTEVGGFDVSLEVDQDGTIHYCAHSLQDGKWHLLRVTAQAKLADGKWHHIAVSRNGEASAIVYVDGIPVVGPAVTLREDEPTDTVEGLKAFIGAAGQIEVEQDGQKKLVPVRPFCGLIADVRVWDTFLEPAEISARMHVKLRGSEPDLLAFWNFDRQTVDDAGPDQHHGRIVGAGEQPIWWLSDLAFEKPSYPYVTTTAKVYRDVPGEAKTYEVTCAIRRADGTGMAGQPIDLWYVKSRQDQPLEMMVGTDAIAGVKRLEEPEPGTVFPDGKRRVVSLKTGANGSVSFYVTPGAVDHTPAIDLRAAFMARHERFHLNVLLDEQRLTPATPPSLVAQSKLIQDYSHSSGGKIDENRDRSTWRTVIRVTNPDGTLRVGEQVSLWCEAQATVQVAGKSYAINSLNSAELVTDGQGEVVVVSDATALTAPSLMARAGFMHREDRVVIAPDQDLHRTLTDVKGSDFTEKRATRWTPDMKEGEGEALLDGEYAPHADKVADAIVTVMASAKPADAEPSAPPRGEAHVLRAKARGQARRKLRGAERLLYDADPMRQPERAAGCDRVVTLRTMGNVPRHVALNPDATRAALADNPGFVFEVVKDRGGRNGVRFEVLKTQAEVEAERGEATPEPVILRGIFGDVWDFIEDVATDIYDGATKIVVSVADAVQLAIHTFVDGIAKIVHVVVDSIVEAVNAVAGFFEQLGVMIMKAIEFLRALFNWKAILATKRILSDLFDFSISEAKAAMTPERLEAAFAPLIGSSSLKVEGGDKSVNGETAAAGDPNSRALDEARSVQGQMVVQKSRENEVSPTTSGSGSPQPAKASSPFDEILTAIPNVLTGILDLSFSDMVDKLMALLKGAVEKSVRLMITELKAAAAMAIQVVDWTLDLLRAEIRIPFVSELYEWITGSPLTILDLICLGLAVPLHVAHLIVTGLRGNPRTFADDNANLVNNMRTAARGDDRPRVLLQDTGHSSLVGAEGMPTPQRMGVGDAETLIVVLRAFNIGFGLVSDASFTKTVSSGGIGAASTVEAQGRGMAKMFKGMTGIIAASLQTFYTTPKFEARLQSGVTPEQWSKIKPASWMKYAIFGLQGVGDLITFGGGAKQLLSPSPAKALDPTGMIPADPIDRYEYYVALTVSVGCIGLIGYRCWQTVDMLDTLKDADDNLRKQILMYGIRDVSMVVSRMPWCMFTQTGANEVRNRFKGSASYVYGIVTGARLLAQGSALATDYLGTFYYGERP